MSLVGPILDGILIALLLVALAYGLRLERQLKTLRSGQEIFARTVTDLDAAAINARASISELKTLTEESQDLLHGRIMAARELLPKLEQAATRAERASASLEQALDARQKQSAALEPAIKPERADYRSVAPRFAEVVEMAQEPGSVESHIQAIQAALKAARARVIDPEFDRQIAQRASAVASRAEPAAHHDTADDEAAYLDDDPWPEPEPTQTYRDELYDDRAPDAEARSRPVSQRPSTSRPSLSRMASSRLDRALGDRS